MTKRELRERLYDYIKIELKINDGYEDKSYSYYGGLIKVLMFASLSGIITTDMYFKIKDELLERKYDARITLESMLINIKAILKIK
jgi:hypothetical protein